MLAVVFEEYKWFICFYYTFFFFSLSLSFSKRSTILKFEGGGLKRPQSPRLLWTCVSLIRIQEQWFLIKEHPSYVKNKCVHGTDFTAFVLSMKILSWFTYPANIYLCKVNNRNIMLLWFRKKSKTIRYLLWIIIEYNSTRRAVLLQPTYLTGERKTFLENCWFISDVIIAIILSLLS